VAGKKYGRFVALIQQALRELKPEEARAAIERGGFELAVDGERLEVTLDELIIVVKRAKIGFASAYSLQNAGLPSLP